MDRQISRILNDAVVIISPHLTAQFFRATRLDSGDPSEYMINPTRTASCSDELTSVGSTPAQLAGDLLSNHRAVFQKMLIQETHPEILIKNMGSI